MQVANSATSPEQKGAGDRLLAEYNRDPRGAWIALAICGLLLLVGLACAAQLPGTPQPATGNGDYFLDPQAGLKWNLLWVGTLAGLITGVIGVPWAFFSAVIIGKRQLSIHDGGFALKSRELKSREGVHNYSWDDVQSCSFPVATDYGGPKGAAPGMAVKLWMADGRRFTFDSSYRGPGNLAGILTAITYGPTLEHLATHLLAGQSITLGPVTISPDGLLYRNRQVSWTTLAGATIEGQYLAILECDPERPQNSKPLATLHLAQVPNAAALAQIIQTVVSNAGTMTWDRALQSLLAERKQANLLIGIGLDSVNKGGALGGQRRPKPAALALIGLLGLAGVGVGIALTVSGISSGAEAARYRQAPVCAPGQSSGCRGSERVTVISWTDTTGVRGSNSRYVTVQLPGDGMQDIYDEGGDLYPRLLTGQGVNAELWNGEISILDDGEGHQLISADNPVTRAANDPISGVLLILFGGFWLLILWLLIARRPVKVSAFNLHQ